MKRGPPVKQRSLLRASCCATLLEQDCQSPVPHLHGKPLGVDYPALSFFACFPACIGEADLQYIGMAQSKPSCMLVRSFQTCFDYPADKLYNR